MAPLVVDKPTAEDHPATNRLALATKKELRVLHVFSALGVGGAETWLMALLRYFHERRSQFPVQMDVCLTGGQPNHFDEEARDLGARLFYLPYTRKNIVGFARAFRKVLREGNYDAIHDHQDYTAGWHFLFGLGRLPHVRVAHVHNPYFCVTTREGDAARRLTLATGKRLLSFLATDVTGTSLEILGKYGFQAPMFKRLGVRAVHCGFDVCRYNGNRETAHAEVCNEFRWETSAKILLFVGRLNTVFGDNQNQKNPFFALEVAKECIAGDPTVRMLFAGGGDDVMQELQARVDDWGLTGNIHLLGIRDDVPRLMLGSNLLLFPSLEEGLGMAAVEAQAAGLRVLASDFVPREAVVIPDSVRFLSITDGPKTWAHTALSMMALEKRDVGYCNDEMTRSPFSIQGSAETLIDCYTRMGVARKMA
jgi:glycosyltransferase EpsF